MKIETLKLTHLRNDAHFQFFADFSELVNEEGAETLKIATQFQSLTALFNREDEALKKIAKSEFTAKIQAADSARDEMFAGMTEITGSCLKHYDEQVRDAATRLKILFDTYKKIDKKNLMEQTAAVTNMMQELNGRYAPDVAAVGVGGWAAQLETRNNALHALIKERFDESAAKTDIVLRDARLEVDKQYRIIVERINALVIVEGPDAYESFIRRLNAIIAKYTQYITTGQGRRAAKKGGAGWQPPEPEEGGDTEEGGETEGGGETDGEGEP
jgi:hypothetical protein